MTLDKVKKMIAEHLELDVAQITEATSFEDVGLDSLDTVEILMKMEDEFGIEIDGEEVGKTVGSLAKYIEQHQ